jgi:pimeloyl-ACP methyl ester carboxylesterase
MPVFDCTRALAALALVLVSALGAPAPAAGQTGPESAFTIYVRSASLGSEQVSVEKTAEGWTISGTGRVSPPVDLVLRQFKARYTADWAPLELTIDATIRGQASRLHTIVSGTTATTEISGAPGAEPVRRTDAIDPQALFLPTPFISPYEAVAARTIAAAQGTTIVLFQPGQGSFTALVGESVPETIQTVDRVIEARRTALTFQAGGQPPIASELWADDTGRLLRLRIPSQGLDVAREDIAAVSTRRLTMARPNDVDVWIQANGFSIAGTLSKPADAAGPLPAVILVSGSGPTDRDETVAGIPIFGQIANALADAGFAVLRYDKRGIGQSGGRPESATLADYTEDLRAAIRMMRDRKDIDRRRIALVGHSEGGALALMAAAKEKNIAGVALLSTIGSTGAEINLYQVGHALERANRPEAERQSTVDLQKRIQQAVITGKGWEGITIPDAIRRQADTPYFQSFLTYDPAKVMKDVRQPLLIVQGMLDVQVPPSNADQLEALARQRKKAPPVDVVKVPGVNHLLVPAKTGEVDEYAQLGTAAVSPDVLGPLTAWLKKTIGGTSG